MKPRSIAFLLLVSSASCLPLSGSAAQDRKANLRWDAVHLAAYLYERSEEPPQRLPVSPPVALIDSIHTGLLSIFALSHPARDSVFEMYEIRAAVEGTHSAVVSVDSLAPWLDIWTRGLSETGIPGIDSILGPLDVLAVVEEDVSIFGDRDFAIRFEVPANWFVLRQRLMQVPTIQDVGPRFTFIGGGNRLVLERADGRWRFRFTVGWGDCPSGCVNRHNWIFQVDRDGEARFVESSGDPLPGRQPSDSL